MAATNSQSPRHARVLLVRVPLEQRQVHVVRLPGEVEQIAQQRHEADEGVDRDVEDHPQLHDLRDAELARLPEDADREQRRDQVAEAGNETEDRIEADADGRARHDERRIEQLRDLRSASSRCTWPGSAGGGG